MTVKSDQLASMRQGFVSWFDIKDPHIRREFEVKLDRLLYAAFAVAQEPYVKELEAYRDITLKTMMLSPKGSTND
jgi:hypothetical protein